MEYNDKIQQAKTVPLTDAELKEANISSMTPKGILCPPEYTNILVCPAGYVENGTIQTTINGIHSFIGIYCKMPDAPTTDKGLAFFCPGYPFKE